MASPRIIEETLDRLVAETPEGGGLIMTVNVRVYDNGMVNIAGIPLTDASGEGFVPGGSTEAWIKANEMFAHLTRRFARRARARANTTETAQ